MIQQQPGDTPVLGGSLICSQVVEKLLEEMRTGCYAQGPACLRKLNWQPTCR